ALENWHFFVPGFPLPSRVQSVQSTNFLKQIPLTTNFSTNYNNLNFLALNLYQSSSKSSIIMLKNFFLLCSGSDKQIIESCSNGEQNKYAGIGATVFFTAVMAFIAGSYALYTVFDNVYTAVFFGFVWCLLIFNLDRFIVATIKKRDSFLDEFIQASPRIVLAVIIAIVISIPLEIKIFEKEINTVLLKEKNEMALNNKKQVVNYFQTDVDQNKAQIDSLKSDILKKEKEVNDLYTVY